MSDRMNDKWPWIAFVVAVAWLSPIVFLWLLAVVAVEEWNRRDCRHTED